MAPSSLSRARASTVGESTMLRSRKPAVIFSIFAEGTSVIWQQSEKCCQPEPSKTQCHTPPCTPPACSANSLRRGAFGRIRLGCRLPVRGAASDVAEALGEVGGIESSVYSTPPDDQDGALAVSGAPCWDGEAENSLPTPCTDNDAHFRRAARGGPRPARPLEGHVSGSEGQRRRRCCKVEGRAGTLRHGEHRDTEITLHIDYHDFSDYSDYNKVIRFGRTLPRNTCLQLHPSIPSRLYLAQSSC